MSLVKLFISKSLGLSVTDRETVGLKYSQKYLHFCHSMSAFGSPF